MPVLNFTQHQHRLLAIGAIPVAIVATALPAQAADTPSPEPARASAVSTTEGSRPLTTDRSLTSLDDAVTADLLDPAVLRELRRSGAVEAMVASTDQTAGRPGLTIADQARALRLGKPDLPASGARLLRDYANLPVRHVRFTSESALLRVLRDGRTATVSQPASGLTAGAVSDTAALNLVGRNRLATGWNGTGTYVAVLDTGAYIGNAPFGCTAVNTPAGCKVAGAYEYAGNDGEWDFAPGPHGTNVAGVVANVAPGARLLIQDVFETITHPVSGKLVQSWREPYLTAAIDDLIRWKGQGFNVVAANFSLGTSNNYWTSTCSSTLSTSLARLRAAGIIPVVAAGNDAQTGSTKVYDDGVSSPACAPDAFVVGAVADGGADGAEWCPSAYAADTIACFSQGGSLVDVVAPGLVVDAAGVTMAGTSQAAPHVAGAIAVLAQARPASPDRWLAALRNSGPVLYDRRSGTVRPTPRLDLVSAVTAVQSADSTPPSVGTPAQVIATGRSTDTAGRLPVTMQWAASDSSGVTAYEVWLKINGTWTSLATGGRGEKSGTWMLSPGSSYQLAVKARDAAGNWSGWSYGTAFGVARIDDKSTSIVLSSGWNRSSYTGTTGGTYLSSATAGATLRVPFTGRGVAVQALTWSGTGQARFYIDGTLVQTVDTTTTTTQVRRLVFSRQVTPGAHTLVIQVVGTSGRPTVAVDAVDVLT